MCLPVVICKAWVHGSDIKEVEMGIFSLAFRIHVGRRSVKIKPIFGKSTKAGTKLLPFILILIICYSLGYTQGTLIETDRGFSRSFLQIPSGFEEPA